MSLRRLKWLSVVLPVAFLLALDVIRHTAQPDLLHAWPGYLLVAGLVLVGALFYADAIFDVVRRMHRHGLVEPREPG